MSKHFAFWNLARPWKNLSIRRQGYFVIAIPILCLVGSLGTFSWLRYSIDTAQGWVDHTDRTLFESNQILNEVLNAETGGRGYALTYRSEFLAPYHQAKASLGDRLTRLQQLVDDNPQQLQRVQQLKQLVQSRLLTLATLIQEVNQLKSNRLAMGQFQRPLLKGKREMDQLRAKLAQFEAEENRLLKIRRQRLNEQRMFNEIALWLAAGISIVGSGFALSLFSQLERSLKDREIRLQESKTLLEAIVSNVVDGVVILDPKGCIESLNAATSGMFGYTVPEAVGQDLSLLLHAPPPNPSTDQPNKDWLNVLIGLPQYWMGKGYRADGSAFPVEISLSQIPFDRRYIVIIRDSSERQQVAEELQARADDLARTNATLAAANTALAARNLELDQFAYVASHDLKAPLRAIASLSEWLEEDLADQVPPESKNQFHLLRRRVQRMETLINGLLQYSRIGRTEIPLETVDVQHLLTDIVDTLGAPSSFTLTLTSPMPILKTRRLPLRQVFANLLDNAYKHHPRATGQILISATDQGAFYEFAVQDDGDGIAPQYHPKIFAIFQTLKPRDAREDTGIGLAIAKKILETEGGKIWVESQEGQGAIFRFTWPKLTP